MRGEADRRKRERWKSDALVKSVIRRRRSRWKWYVPIRDRFNSRCIVDHRARTSIATAQREPREISFSYERKQTNRFEPRDNYEKTDTTLGVEINVSFRINLFVSYFSSILLRFYFSQIFLSFNSGLLAISIFVFVNRKWNLWNLNLLKINLNFFIFVRWFSKFGTVTTRKSARKLLRSIDENLLFFEI